MWKGASQEQIWRRIAERKKAREGWRDRRISIARVIVATRECRKHMHPLPNGGVTQALVLRQKRREHNISLR